MGSVASLPHWIGEAEQLEIEMTCKESLFSRLPMGVRLIRFLIGQFPWSTVQKSRPGVGILILEQLSRRRSVKKTLYLI
jgi:hypothetical protein